jgi:cytochrome P450
MAMHPEIQAKAQAEIGAVIAADNRLPVLSDMDQMPYVRAIIKETLRCGTITPVGVPHKLREDDVSKGYFIPKDSVVIVNAWCVHHSSSHKVQTCDANCLSGV